MGPLPWTQKRRKLIKRPLPWRTFWKEQMKATLEEVSFRKVNMRPLPWTQKLRKLKKRPLP